MSEAAEGCVFCEIVAGRLEAAIVHQDEATIAFLDRRPLFFGHTLLIPRVHIPTLMDIPVELIAPLFAQAKRIAQAVQEAMGADGIFVGINNNVSQSVPHLHIHIVPRQRGDGLKGFFWPRRKYESGAQMAEIAARIRQALSSRRH